MQNVAVAGAGGWGTALALLISQNNVRVTLWGHTPERIEEMKQLRENRAYLPSVTIPERIHLTHDLHEIAGADVLLFVTPSKAIRELAVRLQPLISSKMVFISCTKGIEMQTGFRMSEVLQEFFPQNEIAVLSGPNLASEIARGMPGAAVLGANNETLAAHLQQLCSGKFFRVYTSEDRAGIEIGGALKNIFAIAAGVGDGLRLGDNAKAALVTRALAELIRLGIAMGGCQETFRGLSGIGDLMVTCFSKQSRNRGFGERLGAGETPEQISAAMQMIAEGVPTARSAHQLAQKLGIETPIIDQVHALLYEKRSPREAMMELLNRDPRPEQDH
jgi:glycerol-3-phosphate dehydrogenase (NAD(P)+)